MSLDTYHGTAWAFREWMQQAQRDIDDGGEIKPARVIAEKPDWKKVRLPRWRLLKLLQR